MQINRASIVPFDPGRHLRWNKMEADEKTLLGPVKDKFKLKLPDGTVDTVNCNLYSKEFSYHQSSFALKYHLNAKHLVASSQVRAATAPEAGASSQPRQDTLDRDALNLEWDGNVINVILICTVC